MKQRRNEWLAANGPCVDCGNWDDLRVDHVVAADKVSHRIWSWSAARREAELAKCVVRCLPCHVAKTVRSGELPDTCGGGARNGFPSKLTEDDVRLIRASSLSTKQLAAQLGVNSGTVSLIRRGLRWKHVT